MWRPLSRSMSCMLFRPHVYHVIQFEVSQYFKIIQDWSTVIWSSTMGMECPLNMDVELHYMGKCGILEVTENINDR